MAIDVRGMVGPRRWSRDSMPALFGDVRISKLGTPGPALGVRQVLRTMVASSAIKVEKLCTGVPSSSV